MSSTTSYPLIGIDWNRNETAREWPGRNWEDAANGLAMRYGFAEVLSNFTGQKRGGNGLGMYHRKPLYKAPESKRGGLNGSGKLLPAAPTLGDLLSPRSKLPSLSLMNAPALIKVLRPQGFVFELKYIDGKRKMIVDKQITSSITNAELDQVLDIVKARRKEFVEALASEPDQEDEAQADTGSNPSTEPADPLKGKKLKDVILSMLPQMPTPFTVDDLADRLRVAGYNQLSGERMRLLSSIHYAKKNDHVLQKSYGKYEVTEACRHRRHPPEQPKEAPDATVASEPTVAPSPNPRSDEISVEACLPPREVIEVPAPQASNSVPPPLAALAAPDSESSPRIPMPNIQSPLVGMVLDLASQAAAGADDNAAVAEKLMAAGQQFETTMLDAVAALTASIKVVADQLHHRAATRKALLQSLTGQPQDAQR